MRIRSIIASPLALAAAASALTIPLTHAVEPASGASTDPALSAKQSPPSKSRGPWVVAHRGVPRLAPEETLAAYRRAIQENADVLEGDVQLTKDGELVLVHDDTLARTTDVEERFPDRAPWNVGQLTLAEIKTLDSGSWFSDKFKNERIASVEELLKLNRGQRGITFELKAPQNSPGVAAKLAALVKEYRLADSSRTRSGAYKIMIHSRSQDALREFSAVLPKVPLVYLTGGVMLDDAALDELSTWTIGVFATPRLTTAADIKRATQRGLQVYSDPVDSAEEMHMAIDQGYTWLVTNLTETAVRVRDDKRFDPHGNDVVVDHVFENPSGDDIQPENGEYVALRNTTNRAVDISNHYLRDQAGNIVMNIGPGNMVMPGSLFRVYVGPGTNRVDAYYNGLTTGILNNTGGDTVTLFSDRDRVEDSYSYIVP